MKGRRESKPPRLAGGKRVSGNDLTAFMPATDWPASAAGAVPGLVVTGVVGGVLAVATVIACRPRTWQANGELRLTDVDVWGDADQ